MATRHPGFKAEERNIERREGVSPASAGAILAAGARHASPAAKRRNPRLKRVGGVRTLGSVLHPDDDGDHEYR